MLISARKEIAHDNVGDAVDGDGDADADADAGVDVAVDVDTLCLPHDSLMYLFPKLYCL